MLRRLWKRGYCSEKQLHVPVMLKEVLQYLRPAEEEVVLDMTFGAGGHTEEILKTCPHVKVLALDRDPSAHSLCQAMAEKYPNRLVPLLGRFSELPGLLEEHQVAQNSLDAVLFDLGCSSMQFDEAERGFSVSKNGPLDMRMDSSRYPESITAADVVAKAEEEDLTRILKVYGEEKQAKKIARAIVEARYTFQPLKTTHQLAALVDSVLGDDVRVDKLQRFASSATKTFQALRIFVNNELNEINYGMILAHRYIKLGGRLVAVTFHSLEDTIVKRHLTGNVIENAINPLPLKYSSYSASFDQGIFEELVESNWQSLLKNVLTPNCEEVESNPRSRSAKLRAAVRVK